MNDVQFNSETGEILEPSPATPVQPKPARKRARKKGNGRDAAKAVPENETPRERFLRVSVIRMKDALRAIDLLASFGRHRANYEYDENDASRLADRLEDAIGRMRRELARPPSRKDEREAERSFTW